MYCLLMIHSAPSTPNMGDISNTDIERHVLTMYGAIPGGNANESIQFLLSLSDTPAILAPSLALLHSSDTVHVQYWAANNIMTRIRKDAKNFTSNDLGVISERIKGFLMLYINGSRSLNLQGEFTIMLGAMISETF